MMIRPLIFLFVALFSCQQKGNNIIGDWQLYSIEKQVENEWQPSSWMKNSKGYLHYGENVMSVHFIPKDEKEKPYWYLANYEYNSNSDIVKHERFAHSNAEDNYKTVERKLIIINDTLIMLAQEHQMRLKWIRKTKDL